MESDQTIQICIEISGQFLRPVTFQVSTSPATALPGVTNDYTTFSQELGTTIPVRCINIAINLDTVVETTEMFQVTLSSAGDTAVNILQSTADVFIMDSSTVAFRFSSGVYSVFENSSESVCAILEGSTVRSITISLQVSSSGQSTNIKHINLSTDSGVTRTFCGGWEGGGNI